MDLVSQISKTCLVTSAACEASPSAKETGLQQSTLGAARHGESIHTTPVRKAAPYNVPLISGVIPSTYSAKENMEAKRSRNLDQHQPVVIMGAGRLGESLITFPNFHVVGLFDTDPKKVGMCFGKVIVESVDVLPLRVLQLQVQRAIIAVPPDAAQSAANKLVAAGVRVILNYAPTNINVPSSVVCERVDPANQFSRMLNSYEPQVSRNHISSRGIVLMNPDLRHGNDFLNSLQNMWKSPVLLMCESIIKQSATEMQRLKNQNVVGFRHYESAQSRPQRLHSSLTADDLAWKRLVLDSGTVSSFALRRIHADLAGLLGAWWHPSVLLVSPPEAPAQVQSAPGAPKFVLGSPTPATFPAWSELAPSPEPQPSVAVSHGEHAPIRSQPAPVDVEPKSRASSNEDSSSVSTFSSAHTDVGDALLPLLGGSTGTAQSPLDSPQESGGLLVRASPSPPLLDPTEGEPKRGGSDTEVPLLRGETGLPSRSQSQSPGPREQLPGSLGANRSTRRGSPRPESKSFFLYLLSEREREKVRAEIKTERQHKQQQLQLKQQRLQRQRSRTEQQGAMEADGSKKRFMAAARLCRRPNVRWSSVAGLDLVKETLQEALELPLKHPQHFAHCPSPWNSILLYGPPGCGKTMLAKAVTTELFDKYTCFHVKAADLQGDSCAIEHLFETVCRAQPAVLVVDNIDIICRRGAHGKQKSEFCHQLELLAQRAETGNVFVLAATNLPWELDVTVLRHFEKRMLVQLPDRVARERILRIHVEAANRQSLPLTESDYKLLVDATEGYSASDIALVVKNALFIPIRESGKSSVPPREVHVDDFIESTKFVRPTMTKEIVNLYERFTERFGEADQQTTERLQRLANEKLDFLKLYS